MPYCARYYALRQKWEAAFRLNAETGSRQSGEDVRLALIQLQAHAEACEDCIAALFETFPETSGKEFQIVSLLGED